MYAGCTSKHPEKRSGTCCLLCCIMDHIGHLFSAFLLYFNNVGRFLSLLSSEFRSRHEVPCRFLNVSVDALVPTCICFDLYT